MAWSSKEQARNLLAQISKKALMCTHVYTFMWITIEMCEGESETNNTKAVGVGVYRCDLKF